MAHRSPGSRYRCTVFGRIDGSSIGGGLGASGSGFRAAHRFGATGAGLPAGMGRGVGRAAGGIGRGCSGARERVARLS
ncbi:hypothetical protein GCM10023205_80140 [Yinghuangia aomiensis]|uniref:Uncharacterized protein n=1 Tax=Yinghuangia aomiensis TaxID=676205 RepID=A0ABP9IE87_9ACTN